MTWSELKRKRGFAGIVTVLVLAVAATLVIVFITAMGSITTAGAISHLEDNGYTVLTNAQFTTLNTKLDNLKIAADAAVVNAETAADTSQEVLDTLLLHNENEMFLFPENTTHDIIFTSGNGVDTWCAWTEIADGATSFATKYTDNDGYLVEMTFRDYHTPDIISIIEIAYDDDDTDVIARVKVKSDFTYVLTLMSEMIPEDSTLYYRMKSELALEHATVDFRYYYRP